MLLYFPILLLNLLLKINLFAQQLQKKFLVAGMKELSKSLNLSSCDSRGPFSTCSQRTFAEPIASFPFATHIPIGRRKSLIQIEGTTSFVSLRVDDPTKIGPVLQDLARKARRNADMKGNDLD